VKSGKKSKKSGLKLNKKREMQKKNAAEILIKKTAKAKNAFLKRKNLFN
jgi:hypothetical protein